MSSDDHTTYYEGEPTDDDLGDDEESQWELGLVGLLLAAGTVLVVFPEPSTSVAGIGLVVAGVALWVYEAWETDEETG